MSVLSVVHVTSCDCQADVVHFIKGYLGDALQQTKASKKASKKSTPKAQPCLLQDLKIGGKRISMTASAATTVGTPAQTSDTHKSCLS